MNKILDYKQPEIQGWMSDEELDWLYSQASRMRSVVEVGCWKGRSTRALLAGCPGPVFAVDHWMGSRSERTGTHAEAGWTDLHRVFMANVGNFANLVVLKMHSIQAAKFFPPGSIDMIFIDGGHECEEVIADIESWRLVCAKLLCGHDAAYPSVLQALRETGTPFEIVEENIWRRT